MLNLPLKLSDIQKSCLPLGTKDNLRGTILLTSIDNKHAYVRSTFRGDSLIPLLLTVGILYGLLTFSQQLRSELHQGQPPGVLSVCGTPSLSALAPSYSSSSSPLYLVTMLLAKALVHDRLD
jgi:hypothetical protein